MSRLLYFVLCIYLLANCSPARRLTRELRTKSIYNDHFTGVALYDPVNQQKLIQHNADKPFTPASNTKLFSFYAGLLTIPDSLPALRYAIRRGSQSNSSAQDDSLIFWGTGNPLLLHPDLSDTTVLSFLRNRPERLFFSAANYDGPRFGPGWAWDDYNDDYSPELASLPIYGNVIRFFKEQRFGKWPSPARFRDSVRVVSNLTGGVYRAEFNNQLRRPQELSSTRQDVPYRWSAKLAAELLADTLHKPVSVIDRPVPAAAQMLRGQLADSLYKRMLYVSDNQFAEQVLFMASAERGLDKLKPTAELRRMLDSVLHYPANAARWVDGSGLSRYNAFTPNILIDLLAKIYAKVPQERLFKLLPAAGQSGTLRNVSIEGKPYIFAKSGSMTGVYNLSGYIQTHSGKLLYFSIMHNNFTQSVSEMRRQTAELLKEIHDRF
jgi:D-alanyl-D-alanine carboxypeptidase/D-alanyl-D-alanine-endopeptidase (penicillin-binding protein 4)